MAELFASDNAESHHSRCFRWLLMLLDDFGKAGNERVQGPLSEILV